MGLIIFVQSMPNNTLFFEEEKFKKKLTFLASMEGQFFIGSDMDQVNIKKVLKLISKVPPVWEQTQTITSQLHN